MDEAGAARLGPDGRKAAAAGAAITGPSPLGAPSRRRPGAAARGPYNVTLLGRGLNVSVCVAEAKRL